MSLRQKRVVVIGGTSGIGLAVALAAQADGASVIVGSSSEAKVAQSAARIPGAHAHTIDVTSEDSVATFFDRVGAFDHLVFTAGDWGQFGAGSAVDDIDVDKARDLFNVRFWGALACVKHARKQMRAGGSVVLTNGTVAHRPRRGSPVSTAMAGAIEHLVHSLAVELAPIRVNGVCPGAVRTDIWNSIPADQREARFAKMTERQLVKRIGEPAEVAEAYLYLMRGGYTTGQILIVDGGQTAV
ncbi:MAG: SDR family oxidoreductase [Proteobacteria bacterium]|nr:SDR family oxidoreductase [Pseudomonadota bacterium]